MNPQLLRAITLILSIGIHAARQTTLLTYLKGRRNVGDVVGLQLFNAQTGATVVAPLVNGTVINVVAMLGTPPPAFKIQAIVSGRAQSVLFVSRSGNLTRAKNCSPFEVCKTASSCPRLGFGNHDLTVTPYRFAFQRGGQGKSITIKFTIKHILPANPTQAPTAAGTIKSSRPMRTLGAALLTVPNMPLHNTPRVPIKPISAPVKVPILTNPTPPIQSVPLSPVQTPVHMKTPKASPSPVPSPIGASPIF